MPPPIVTCCICGESVFKSQTYAMGEKDEEGNPKRACKSHEGVIDKAEKLKVKQQKEKEREKTRQEEKERRRRSSGQEPIEEMMAFHRWADNHCWCCEQPGIHLQTFYHIKLLALEKGKLLNVFSPFGPEMTRLIRGLMRDVGAKCVMHKFPLDEKMRKRYDEWKHRIHHKLHPIVGLGNIIQLCFDCQKRTGIEYDLDANMPKPDIKTLAILGAAYEGSEEHKVMQVVAKASVQEDMRKQAQNN